MKEELTHVNDENDRGLDSFGCQRCHLNSAHIGTVMALARALFDHLFAIDAIYDDNKLDVVDNNEHERDEKDQEEYGHVVAGDGERALGPLHRARRAARLDRVARPADEWQRAPEEREQHTREYDIQTRSKRHLPDSDRLIHKPEAFDCNHGHQVHARTAD